MHKGSDFITPFFSGFLLWTEKKKMYKIFYQCLFCKYMRDI